MSLTPFLPEFCSCVCVCDLNLFASVSHFLTNVASCAHSSVLHASPPRSQPGLPSSLPLPHPWFSWHCSAGEPPDVAQRLHHLAADAPVACCYCHGCPALRTAQGPYSARPASSSTVLHSSTWYLLTTFIILFENPLWSGQVSHSPKSLQSGVWRCSFNIAVYKDAREQSSSNVKPFPFSSPSTVRE